MDAKAFAEKIEQVSQRVAQLMERAGRLPKRHRQMLDNAFGELDGVLEELQAAEHELYEQQVRLEASNQELLAERLRYQNLFELVPDAYDLTKIKSAEEVLRRSQYFIESTLDALPTHMAILDDTGTIVAVNAAWRRFGAANGYADPDAGVGTSYLRLCEQASGDWADEAPSVARGLREILAGQRERFQIEYPCHSPDEQRWFILTMSRFVQDGRISVVTAHLDITERRVAEEQLRESETRFRMFADSAPVLIWLSDAEKQCTFFNRPWLEFTGRALEQELGFGWAEGVHPEDRQRCLAIYEGAYTCRQSFGMEYRLRRVDGEYRWVLDTAVPRYTPDGSFAGYIGSCIDITERKRTENELRRHNETLQTIIDLLPVMLRFRAGNGDTMLINQAYERTLGWTLEEIQQQNLDLFAEMYTDSQERQRVLNFIAAATGEWADFKTRVRDGRLIDTTWANVCLSDGTTIGIGQDITERKQAEEALREAQERTESILSSVADSHILLDRQWRYLYVNTAAARAIGRSPDQILGRTLWELYPDIVGTELDRQFHRAMDERLPVAFDFHYATDNRWWENRFYPAPEGLAAFGTDITERKRAEEALRLYAERLEMLHQLDQAILAARSPVEVIQAALNRLRQLVSCQRAGVLMLGSEGRRAIALVADSNGGFHVEPKFHLTPELLGDTWAVGEDAMSQGLGIASEPLIYDEPPPIIQALLAHGVRSYMVLPLISQSTLIGVLSLGAGEAHAFAAAHLDIAREIASSVAIAIQQARLSEQISDGRARLRSLTRRLVDTQETERRQLAQELHDQVGQSLTALNIGLSIVREHLSAESEAKVGARLDDSARLIAETMARIRDVMAALRPALLDDYGLAAALRWYIQQFSERTGIEVALQIDEEAAAVRLAPEVEIALFRTAQEALTNVVKHAHVEHAVVILETDARVLWLTIDDSGIGFDSAASHTADERHGLGLIGMRERIQAVGGRLELVSAPGKGTHIVAVVWR